MDKLSKQSRSRVMSTIRSTDTGPEVALRKALWQNGLRYRKYYGVEKIDIAFPSKKLAIFVDGCFWHQCPIHSHIPKSNQSYWMPKLAKNAERDAAKVQRLERAGWKVLRFWEHELNDMDHIINVILENMEQLRRPKDATLQQTDNC